MSNNKVCPFRKSISRIIKRTPDSVFSNKLVEEFCKCLGTRCMAFSNGTCLRLSKKED